MLAATLPSDLTGQVADLGGGAGVVGMAAAYRCAKCHVDLFEIDAQLVDVSRQSLLLAHNQQFAGRVSSHCVDINQSAEPLACVKRKPGSYSAILCNPPFNDASHQASPDNNRALAHMASAAVPEVWVKTAAQMAGHRALLALIVRPANLMDYVSAIQNSFGNVLLKPLHARVGDPATRLLIGSRKGSRATLTLLPPLILHQRDGTFTAEAEDILRGRDTIDLFA